MKGPRMAPDDQGGSGAGKKSGEAAPDYAKQWLQDKLVTDMQKELGAAGHLPQDLVVFWGYAADSDREGYARLYLNLQFNEYIEFETNAIVLSKDLGGQDRPFSGIVVWLKRDTTIQHVSLEALDMQRNFLQSTLPQFQGGASGVTGSGTSGGGGGSMICGGGGSMICGGGGSMICGGGGSMICGGGGSMICGGGGSMICGGGGSMICGGGGSMICGGGGSMICGGGGGSMICGGGGSMICGGGGSMICGGGGSMICGGGGSMICGGGGSMACGQ